MHRSILVVDDEPAVQRLIERIFQPKGWNVLSTDSGTEALSLYESDHPAVVILDLHLPTIHGIDLLDVMLERDAEPAIIVLTGDLDPDTAAEVMRRGAENYLNKPVSVHHLQVVVEHAYEKVQLRRRSRLVEAFRPQDSAPLVGSSPTLRVLTEQIRRLAPTQNAILLEGETGTGKNRIAQKIHEQSSRAANGYLELNCAGISEMDLASELFGYEKGAFEGATDQYRGLIELSDGGTLVLDGVRDLPLELQDRVLRFVESAKFRRQGGRRELRADVRIIAATTGDLSDDVRRGRFREELYYRLAAFPLRIPALRERSRADVLAVAVDVLKELRRGGTGEAERVSDEAAELLCRYPWPGNVRELRNALERAVICAPDLQEIHPEHLPAEIRGETRIPGRYPLDPSLTLEEVERMHVSAALQFHGGNRSAAARTLGIARTTLYEKARRLGLEDSPPDDRFETSTPGALR